MPVISHSNYTATFLFQNGNISTIHSALTRNRKPPEFRRQRLSLPDGDFLLIDYRLQNARRAVILCHGLEGHSRSYYINSCSEYFLEKDYSVFAWNNRSCGGEMNLLPGLYHHGSVDDLGFVIHSLARWGFDEIYLIGFSLGGAQIINYLGREETEEQIAAAVVISTPLYLKSSFDKINRSCGLLYEHRLVASLKKKILSKARKFPDLLSYSNAKSIKRFSDVAEYYLKPVYGFKDLGDYCEKASPGPVLRNIKKPVLILNAKDDPIIGEGSYPSEIAESSEFIFLETPAHGGHCAFPLKRSGYSYAEVRAFEFFEGKKRNVATT